MSEYTDHDCLKIENEAMYSEIKRLRADNAMQEAALECYSDEQALLRAEIKRLRAWLYLCAHTGDAEDARAGLRGDPAPKASALGQEDKG